jgi:hypothetical protein
MHSAAAKGLKRRFFVLTSVIPLWLAHTACAQLVSTDQPRFGYARDADRPLPVYIPSAGWSGTSSPRHAQRQELPDAPPVSTLIDPIPPSSPVMQEMFRMLPAETDVDVPSGNAGIVFDGVNVGAAYTTFHHGLLRRSQPIQDPLPSDSSDDDPVVEEGFHWRGLIAQSLLFNLVENSFRAASDDQIRTLLATKPFWHDYVASMRQFNMRRWNDGDDFLVNYVGHPMQGAVSGFIEIQNDPSGREQEMSATHAYWMSRFKAFLWATAYSTHSEISPLGEAGIGNEGGWTYPIHCPTHCSEPGTYKKYTNNTGWVDFVITPTVGSLWLLAEDTLDRFVSDRVQGGNRSRILHKILRGSLNPSRTMANALRFKAPWYRDFQHSPDLESGYGVHVLPSDETMREEQDFRRFALMPYFTAMPLGTAGHPCTACIQNRGGGVEADFALTRWMAVSFAVSKQQDVMDNGPTTNGSTINTGFGIRLMHDRPNNTLSLAVRPGVVTERAAVPPSIGMIHNNNLKQSESSVTHAATTIMVSNDYKVSRMLAFRSSFGVTIARYRNPVQARQGVGKPPYLSWLSHDSFTNRPTWTCEIGPVFHF